MKKLISIIFVLLFISCERKPLYFQGDYALNILVNVEADIDLMWKDSWRDDLLYNWDENKFGKIGYTSPNDLNMVFLSNNKIDTIQNIKANVRSNIDIKSNIAYDVLLHNETDNVFKSNDDQGYYITSTLALPINLSEISDKYINVNQPGEIFSCRIKDLYISDVDDYEMIYENGRNIYIYNLDVTVKPVSYIYIIQFIIINDDDDIRVEAKKLENITVSGISARKNLLTGKAVYTGLNQISTTDIKEPQIKKDTVLFASRVTVLDIMPDDHSSWSSNQNYLYYTIVDIDTYNYGTVVGTLDITRQMMNNPQGGIITVKLLNSEIKKGGSTTGGIGIDIEEWEQHIMDIEF